MRKIIIFVSVLRGVINAKKKNEIARLPSWKLRLDIWFDQLKLDMHQRGIIDCDNISINGFHTAMESVNGIPYDAKTFSNWVNKSSYPEETNLTNLMSASSKSASWLLPTEAKEPFNFF